MGSDHGLDLNGPEVLLRPCAEPGCGAVASAGEAFELAGVDPDGTHRLFRHRRWTCAVGHAYVLLEEEVPGG